MIDLLLVIIIIILIIIFGRPIHYENFEYNLCPNFSFINTIYDYNEYINGLTENTDIIKIVNKKMSNIEFAKFMILQPKETFSNIDHTDNIQIIYNFTKNNKLYVEHEKSLIFVNKSIFISRYAPIVNRSENPIKVVILTIKKPYWFCY
jgi:hypothetical protein